MYLEEDAEAEEEEEAEEEVETKKGKVESDFIVCAWCMNVCFSVDLFQNISFPSWECQILAFIQEFKVA